jgi:DUF4097 and DUF4098 domain-containing protein YvlB
VIETSGGGVEVSVDPSVNLDVDASTSAGSVSSDVPIKSSGGRSRGELSGKIGSGGASLEIRTSAGSIHIGAL